MDRERDITVFGCTLIGCVADIVAILVAVISGRSSVLFFAIVNRRHCLPLDKAERTDKFY